MCESRSDTIDHPKKRAFLAAYARLGTIRAACQAASISRSTYWEWKEHDDQFVVAAGQALQEYGDRLEDQLRTMAIKHKNVTALIVALKIAGRYVERREVSGPDGGPIPITEIVVERPRPELSVP